MITKTLKYFYDFKEQKHAQGNVSVNIFHIFLILKFSDNLYFGPT